MNVNSKVRELDGRVGFGGLESGRRDWVQRSRLVDLRLEVSRQCPVRGSKEQLRPRFRAKKMTFKTIWEVLGYMEGFFGS